MVPGVLQPAPSALQASPSCSPVRPSPARSGRHGAVRVSAFLPIINPQGFAGRGSSSSSKDVVSHRLAELRNRSADEDRLFLQEAAAARARDGDGADRHGGSGASTGPGSKVHVRPWGFLSPGGGEQEGKDDEAGPSGSSGALATRPGHPLVADPKPEIKLLHRFRPGQTSADEAFWSSFVDKCRQAWGVLFPPASPRMQRRRPPPRPRPAAGFAAGVGRLLGGAVGGGGGAAAGGSALVNGLSAKEVVLSRLQMVLIADRCGVPPEQLLDVKAHTLEALGQLLGQEGKAARDYAALQVQVSALKPSGERVTMTLGFEDMLEEEELRDPLAYHYEYEDDDDYFLPEEDDDRVAEIAEAPAAGMAAVRVAATTVSRSTATASAAAAAPTEEAAAGAVAGSGSDDDDAGGVAAAAAAATVAAAADGA